MNDTLLILIPQSLLPAAAGQQSVSIRIINVSIEALLILLIDTCAPVQARCKLVSLRIKNGCVSIHVAQHLRINQQNINNCVSLRIINEKNMQRYC